MVEQGSWGFDVLNKKLVRYKFGLPVCDTRVLITVFSWLKSRSVFSVVVGVKQMPLPCPVLCPPVPAPQCSL